MTTAREYLISKGLAKPGRGRLSRDAHAALAKAIAEGMTFTDSKPAPKPKAESKQISEQISPQKSLAEILPEEIPVGFTRSKITGALYPILESPVMREPKMLYGVDEDGHTIEFSLCFKCAEHMMYCQCSQITPPSLVVRML